jgi:multimeric flavodoxin WrbA
MIGRHLIHRAPMRSGTAEMGSTFLACPLNLAEEVFMVNNPLTAVAINSTLKRGRAPSSTDRLLGEIIKELGGRGVRTTKIRAANENILPGVSSNEGKDDAWPAIRERILASNILILGTPIWLGQPSSVCKRVLERMDAFLEEKDDQGRMVSYGRVALVAVVGNEDGAHHVSAELYQALNDCGFSLAANAVTYWVGEAMGSLDYKDRPGTPKVVAEATAGAVRNAVHLASLLKDHGYPGGS